MIAVLNVESVCGLVALLSVCSFGVVFMVRFFIALHRETRHAKIHVLRSGERRVVSLHCRPDNLIRIDFSSTGIQHGSGARIKRSKTIRVMPSTSKPQELSSVQTISSKLRQHWILLFICLVFSSRVVAQTSTSDPQTASSEPKASPPATPPSPLPTPSMTGPLQLYPPITFEGGPFGQLNLNGVVSGIGVFQGNAVAGDNAAQGALSNGQVFLQKTTSWWQFYIQAGAYDILSLGTPFISTEKSVSDLYGPVPVAYAKLVPGKNTSILIGALPTLMGAEYTFDFQNMNIARGLLWNQENAVNRGIQLNQTLGKFTASFSWNDGYYSNRYSWLSGSLTYTNGPHSFIFAGMGNLSQTKFQTLATPVQNNSSMYAAIYTYSKGHWVLQPYFQYSKVPTNAAVGVVNGASTYGGAVLISRTFKHGFSLAGRGEYLSTTGSVAAQSVNLLYGPGSAAWSLTLTPTYQHKRLFTRGEFSVVNATSFTSGDAFGSEGLNATQPRGVIEIGFLL